MSIQIEILSQKSVTKPAKTPGKTYTMLEVAYKNLTFQGKVEGKNIMSFGATKPAFDVLSTAQSGDVFDIEVVKNTAGYNDWVDAKKGVSGVGTPSSSAAPRSSTGTQATPVRSTYETPEERAKKQVYIIRQSSLSSAIALLSTGAKTPPTVDAILDTASKFEEFVFGEGTPNESVETLAKGVALPAEPEDDIPF